MKFIIYGLLLFSFLSIAGCTKDALPEPKATDCDENAELTYEKDVAGIIERTCAYSGCHLGGAPGVYANYEGLLSDLESGRFRNRVVTQREDPNVGMPPNYAPTGRDEDLTEAELLIITCWLDGGYPKD